MLKAEAWRLRFGENDTFIYRLQVDKVDARQEKKLFRVMYGWQQILEGYDPQTDKMIFGFDKQFKSEEAFHEWGKFFPYYLKEISSTSDRPKPIKLGIIERKKPKKSKPKMKIRGGRRCAKCGRIGHDSRNCSENKPLYKKQGKRRCGYCHHKGHNERTCPKKKLDKSKNG